VSNEEILPALQRILERWKRKRINSDEARREIDKIVFGTLFVRQPAKKEIEPGELL